MATLRKEAATKLSFFIEGFMKTFLEGENRCQEDPIALPRKRYCPGHLDIKKATIIGVDVVYRRGSLTPLRVEYLRQRVNGENLASMEKNSLHLFAWRKQGREYERS